MADTPKNEDPTPTTTDTGGVMHPNGMNPHIVPEKEPVEEAATEEA